MKNCILFIIDSLNYSRLKESSIELMPFMKELESKGLSCSNMFSQAPYTEAAVMNIYCGQNVLDHNGYFFRFKETPLTLFEAMQAKGYKTFFNSYQPQCYPSSIKRGIDYLYYNVGYDQKALWSYRLSHFADLLKENKITENDYEKLYELFDDNFKEWVYFLDALENEMESVNMIRGNSSNYSVDEVKNKVNIEINFYNKDKKTYINEVLYTGNNHRFFKIPTYDQNLKIKDRNFIIQTHKDMRPLFKKIKRMNFKLNLKNAFLKITKEPLKKFGDLFKYPSKVTVKDFLKSIFYSFNYLMDIDLYERISLNYDYFKNAPSAKTHIDHYIDWAKTHKFDSKPHFACIHIDDIHNPEIFFTYDSEDRELLNKEKKIAFDLLKEVPNNYYGSITHDLSLRYMDNTIKYLYEELEKSNMLENTYIAICADHGFSFSGNPIRNSFVVNLFLENYRIPFIVIGSDKKGCIESFCSSKDIPATICDLIDGKIPSQFTGESILNKKDKKTQIIEYCGGGCPDILRRKLKIAAFDDEYFVGTLCTINDSINEHITEIYDLSKDPKQENNLVYKKYDLKKVEKLIDKIKERQKIIELQIN